MELLDLYRFSDRSTPSLQDLFMTRHDLLAAVPVERLLRGRSMTYCPVMRQDTRALQSSAVHNIVGFWV